jgi:hypothetical protein
METKVLEAGTALALKLGLTEVLKNPQQLLLI